MVADAETIKKLMQKCYLKKMYGQVVISLEGGEVKSVDVKEHLKPEDLASYINTGKFVVAIKKDSGGENGNIEGSSKDS
jgi:hypothetical protein